jgi:UMF1 family MFS transporter
MFGFYTLCGKSAAIMGPLVFGGISHAAGGNQRRGILAIGSFFVIGLVLLSRMRGGGPTGASAALRSVRGQT